MSLYKNTFGKTTAVAEFRQTSLADSRLEPRVRLEQNCSVFYTACGDLVSMLAIHVDHWEAAKLRQSSLFILALVAFDEILKDMKVLSFPPQTKVANLRDGLYMLLDWLANKADAKTDVRQVVALMHAMSFSMQCEVAASSAEIAPVHPELQAFWRQLLGIQGVSDIGFAFDAWKEKFT
ncbi:MAG TPA: hypothetical protein VEF04_06110 [Blastocatellia bacterium]|nr:hypothetical protein [Blastocatellia bacterium]